jgi:hypothetical protein
MKVHKYKRAPKTYKEPKYLSLDATGLLTHMRANVSSDRTYRWGVEATADFFGLGGRNRIRNAYDELEEKGEVRNVLQRPLPSGKQPPRVVRLKPWSQITTEQSRVNTGDSCTTTKAVVTGDHHYIDSSTTVLQSVGIENSSLIGIENVVVTDNHGSSPVERRRLEKQLKAAQATLRLRRVQAKKDASLFPVVATDEALV